MNAATIIVTALVIATTRSAMTLNAADPQRVSVVTTLIGMIQTVLDDLEIMTITTIEGLQEEGNVQNENMMKTSQNEVPDRLGIMQR